MITDNGDFLFSHFCSSLQRDGGMDGIDDDEKYPVVCKWEKYFANKRQYHDDSTGIIKYEQTPSQYHLRYFFVSTFRGAIWVKIVVDFGYLRMIPKNRVSSFYIYLTKTKLLMIVNQ